MHRAVMMIRNLAIGVAVWATAGIAAATTINLQPFAFTFNNPIGIDFQDTPCPFDPNGCLIMSVNYFLGNPHNLDLVDPTSGAPVQFSTLAGLENEVKVATVRAGACHPGFADGEVFTGNGNPGQIIRIGPTGTLFNPIAPYAWATLPGEPADLRGSLFQDRFCAAGGDLIAVTGNEQTGFTPNDIQGNVWRINSSAVPTQLSTTISTHLEGVVTLPNNPAMHGPAAGKILAGAEEFQILGRPPATSADYDSNGGAIYVIDPAGGDLWFTISNGHSAATACSYNPVTNAATPNHCNFHTATAFHPEDLDLIRRNSRFFGVAFSEGHVLTTVSTVDNTTPDFHQFDSLCGQVLITQELPFPGTSGLNGLSWNGTGFDVTPILANHNVFQWEHVTFTSGDDCMTTLSIVKSPKNATFNIGDTLTFTLVVTNTGHDTANNAVLDDPLPTTGGLTWSLVSTSAGTCNPIPVSQVLHCDLGNMAPGAVVTVVVNSNNAGGAPAASCTGQKLNNIGTASATNAPAVTDHGDYTCTPPPHLKVVKTPDGGTFTQGGPISYSIVVSNDGLAGSIATNVHLSDQLPTNGTLNWFAATININPAQGSCSMSASSLLNCSLGSIAAGAANAVTVTVSLASTPAAACQSQPNPVALATADGGLSAQDAGSPRCKMTRSTPHLVVVKTPDGGTFTQGGAVSFTIVVGSDGQANSVAHAVQLNDQLPTNGGLNWSGATVTTTQGSCSINASSLLTCSLGDINAGASVTVTVSRSSTPAAACQSQPNPHAIATSAPDNLIADDSGSLTCTPPPPGLGSGDTATIGFWANKNGQGVITCENGGANSTALGNSLASNYPNLFGNLAGKTNTQVAAAFTTAKGNVGGVQGNTYAQAFAVALAVYVTNSSTGTASCVSKFGFNFGAGTGGKSFNVGSNGAAFGVPNNTSITVLQALQTANANYNPATGLFYGGNQTLTSDLNNVLDGINQGGDIS